MVILDRAHGLLDVVWVRVFDCQLRGCGLKSATRQKPV